MDAVPKVKARKVRRQDRIWILYITCPFCGKKHQHGGGHDDDPNLGFRTAHCTGQHVSRDYELV